MEIHVHGLGSTVGGGFIYNTECRCVVDLHWRRWLGVAHCDEGVPGGGCFAAIDVERSEFGLGG